VVGGGSVRSIVHSPLQLLQGACIMPVSHWRALYARRGSLIDSELAGERQTGSRTHVMEVGGKKKKIEFAAGNPSKHSSLLTNSSSCSNPPRSNPKDEKKKNHLRTLGRTSLCGAPSQRQSHIVSFSRQKEKRIECQDLVSTMAASLLRVGPLSSLRLGAVRSLATAAAEYDLAVIGAGPGGYVAAIKAAQLGLKVGFVFPTGASFVVCVVFSSLLLLSPPLFHDLRCAFLAFLRRPIVVLCYADRRNGRRSVLRSVARLAELA
jgi:hypothetical protein